MCDVIKNNKVVNYVFILIASYILSILVCFLIPLDVQTIIAHGTGIITMSIQVILLVSTTCLYKKIDNSHKNKSLKTYLACCFFGSLTMFLGYFFYIFLNVSPSNVTEKLHAISSIVLDLSSSIYPISCLLGLNIIFNLLRNKQ